MTKREETKDNIAINTSIEKESHVRSIIKGITWRIIATSTTITIAYMITGHAGDALKIGAIEFVGKVFIYYMHERAWLLVPRGTFRKLLRNQ